MTFCKDDEAYEVLPTLRGSSICLFPADELLFQQSSTALGQGIFPYLWFWSLTGFKSQMNLSFYYFHLAFEITVHETSLK